MSNQNWTDWVSEPIVVVPVSLAFATLMFVPFVVTDTDHAAQFYGAFVAAIIAAGAVVGNSFFQARLVDRRASLDRKHLDAQHALYLYGYIETLKAWLQGSAKLWAALKYNMPVGTNPSPNDATISSVEVLRRGIKPDAESELQNALSLATSLPPEIAAPITITIFSTIHEWPNYRLNFLHPQSHPERRLIEPLIALANSRVTTLDAVSLQLRDHLRKMGYLA